MTPLEDRVQRAEVALVYEQARAGFAISLFNGLVFFVLLRDVTPRAALWAWLAFLVAVSVARAVLVRAHSRATAAGPIDALAWRRRFVASAFVGGTVWGSLALLLFPSGSLPHQLAIGFVIAGLAAGAVSYFSSVPGAYYAFALSALIPYAVRLLFVGGALPTTLAFLSLIYTASLAINVRRVHIVIRGSFRARFANEALVEQMRAEVLEREAAQERLAASEERFRGAFESVSVGMALLDEGGRFLLVNRALCSMLGYAETELLSRFFDDFLVGDESPDIHDRVASTSTANGPDVAFEERLLTKDGQERWMEGGMRAVRGARGERRFVAQLADVTERRALERLKSEFIATVSHELRTPLTAIQGAVDLLAGGVGGVLPETAADLVDTAASNAVRLRKLVDDLLDFEKLSSEDAGFVRRRVRLVALVDEMIAAAAPFASRHGVVMARVGPPSDVEVETDPDRLGQVILNLLSNAAKFSNGEGARVEASVHAEGPMAIVSVKDRGVGIPAAFHSRIFQKFSQVDSSDSRAKGGTGLGLSISKAIVEKLGGEISFESAVGVGTTFHVKLPRVRDAKAEVRAQSA